MIIIIIIICCQNEENEKRGDYRDLARGQKKTMEHSNCHLVCSRQSLKDW